MRARSPRSPASAAVCALRVPVAVALAALATLASCGRDRSRAARTSWVRDLFGGTQTQRIAEVRFVVDVKSVHPISPYVYGVNFLTDDASPQSAPWYGARPPAGVTLNRMGGNRLSAYNWETNYSNAGNDYQFQNDTYLGATTIPGEAVRSRAAASFARGAAFMATVPMLGYVAADAAGPVDTSDATRAQRLDERFKVSRPAKGAPFATAPDPNDGYVYQDEFVNWLETTFPSADRPGRPIFYSLDNEPDIWHATHAEIQGKISDRYPRLQSYDGFMQRTIEYARAIKAVAPDALLFGPATATWAGMATLGRYPSPDPVHGRDFFLDFYLDGLRAAERSGGRRLVDVLDLHWYPANGTSDGSITDDYAPQTPSLIEARLQAPRSLWDSTFHEHTWVTDAAGGPIRLLPRLRETIARHYPGTKVAITEYYYGRGGDISGGIAQADVLGIFGREGVFAAALWPQAGVRAKPYGGDGRKAYAFAFAAFRMYRDFDGNGGRFGDQGVAATTSDVAASSVYASRDSAGRLVLVAINKTDGPLPATIALRGGTRPARTLAYVLTAASPTPARGTDPRSAPDGTVRYTMPAMSVSTLVLGP